MGKKRRGLFPTAVIPLNDRHSSFRQIVRLTNWQVGRAKKSDATSGFLFTISFVPQRSKLFLAVKKQGDWTIVD